ncbi:MAG: hypothetical protein AAFP19_22075 [Bacteroidota bacterium]
MKRMTYLFCSLILLSVLSTSCKSMRKSRGGGWYHNRNNVYQPTTCPAEQTVSLCLEENAI